MATRSETSSLIISVDDVPWHDQEPGMRIKSLWSDRASARSLVLARLDPGARIRHRHNGDALTLVIEGAISDEWTVATTGTLCHRPAGCAHTETTEHGVTTLALMIGGVEPAEDAPGGGPSVVFPLHALPWEDPMPGLSVKRIWEHPSGEPRAALMRFAPGTSFPAHRHDGDELIYVLEGSIDDEDGQVRAGMVAYRPPGCAHTVTTTNGATALGFATGQIVFL